MLYRRGRVWWIKIKYEGQLIRQSTGTKSKELARRVGTKVLTELEKGKWFEKELADNTLFNEVWQKYLEEECRYNSKGHYERALQVSKNILPQIGDFSINKITPAILNSYKVRRLGEGVTLSTVVKELGFVRRVFSLCKKEWQFIPHSPFEYYKMPRVNDKRVRFLSVAAMVQLIDNCSDWLKPIVILAGITGIRRGNLLSLTWKQVDLSNKLISLGKTKNGNPLTVPLNETACSVFFHIKRNKVKISTDEYVFKKKGEPCGGNEVAMAFRRACKKANLDDFRFHDLRHHFASSLAQNGTDIYVIQCLLGHKDGRMTQRYTHLKIENLRKAVNTLEGAQKGAQC